jgi:hypothetical protein
MKKLLPLLFVVSCVFIPGHSSAKSVEAGSVWLGAQLGFDSKMGGRVGGSDTLLAVGAEVEYALESRIGIYARGLFGLGDTQAIKLESGVKYRFTGIDFPLSPYVSAHLRTGHLLDVMGANLWSMGAGFGGGADYFLTRHFTAGLDLTFDFGSTLGERPTGYNTFDVVITARYSF